MQWIPTVDGKVLIGEPHDIIVQNQTWNKVPLIIGSMRNETDAWVPSNLSEIEYKALFDTAMDLQWGKGAGTKIDHVYNTSSTYFEKVGLASTDWLMTCYVRRIAKAASQQNVPTFLYHFLHYNSIGADPTNAVQPNPKHPACNDGRAACHAGDNMYTMGSVKLLPNASFTNLEENISNGIMSSTARLVEMIGKTKNTIAAAVLPLVLYDETEKSLAWGGTFDTDGNELVSAVVENFRSDVCDFWDAQTPK